MSDALRVFPKGGAPETEDGVPARLHVCGLRAIQPHTLLLAFVLGVVLVEMPVPVVAVEFDGHVMGGNHGVHGELAADPGLPFVVDAQVVEDTVTDSFDRRGRHLLLLDAHPAEHFVSRGVGVAALQRAIGDVVGLGPGGRPPEGIAAGLAGVLGLVPSLPRDLAILATEKSPRVGALYSAAADVRLGAAPVARNVFALPPLSCRRNSGALPRTVLLRRRQMIGALLAADDALDCAYLVSLSTLSHTVNLAQNGSYRNARSVQEVGSAGAPAGVFRAGGGRVGASQPTPHLETVKPIDLCRWLVRLVTRKGHTVLDPFMGSGSIGCATLQERRRYIGLDLNPEYVEIAKARLEHWTPKQVDMFMDTA